MMNASEHTVMLDADWQRHLSIVITPDPRLSLAQQDVIAHDYDMADRRLIVDVRAKLLPYLIQVMQIDLDLKERDPRAQQLVIANQSELEPWLFPAGS